MKDKPIPEPEELYERVRTTLEKSQDVVVAVDSSSASTAETACDQTAAAEDKELSLALVGKFQSGKSTLYNYLCGGRELSPMGPGNGGIPTSAGRVTAHPLPEGEKEYADIRWRTPDELAEIIAKGKYSKPTEEQIQETLSLLSNSKKRTQLETELLRQLRDPAPKKNRDELRLALLALHFFPAYQEEIKRTRFEPPEDATLLSSYPQDWELRWQQLLSEKEDAGVEKYFKKKDVSFIFCADIRMYVDSDLLRKIGVSITDCPGYMACDRDTEIARESIRSADIVLYLMEGENQLDSDDKKELKYILSEKKTLLIACNLHKSESQWERILNNSVCPDLKDMGAAPEIVTFHAAMALRAQELCMAQQNLLPASERAILDGQEGDVVKKLQRKLKKYWEELRDNEDCPRKDPDYFAQESKICPLLKTIHSKAKAIRELRAAYPHLNEIQRKLQETVDQLDELAECERVKNQITTARKGVGTLENSWKEIEKKFLGEARRSITNRCEFDKGEIRDIARNHTPRTGRIFGGGPPKSQRRYESYIREQVGKTASCIVRSLKDSTTLGNALCEMRQNWEKKYSEIQQLVGKLPKIAIPKKHVFPKDLADLFKKLPDDKPDTREFYKGEEIPGWSIWDSTDSSAEKITGEMKKFLSSWLLKELDKYPYGPLNILKNTVDTYKERQEGMATSFDTYHTNLQSALNKKQAKGMDKQKVRELKKQIDALLQDCHPYINNKNSTT